MKTYRVKRTKGKVLATGYKIFTSDWGNKNNSYIYGTNDNIVGTIHKVDGNIEQCRWGLHFCPNPIDCYGYYEPCQWNKFAKVEAYDQLIDNGDKYVTNMLKIVEIYTFQEFIEEIKKYMQENISSSGISDGYGISYGYGIRNGYGISDGSGISDGYGISYGYGIRNGSGISDGSGIRNGYGISDGYGINKSWGLTNCEGCSKCILCYDYTGKLAIFNKKVSEERFNEVYNILYYKNWYPKFNNAYDLKGDKEWEETDITRIEMKSLKEAWEDIPQEIDKYIKSLPEFDEEIYNKIRGIKC